MQKIILGVLFMAGSLSVIAASEPEFQLVIENHRFVPETLTVPAAQKIKLIIHNKDATPEEFESHDLRREKIVPAQGQVILWVGPLKPGSYHFFGEFNPKTATGTMIVK